MIKWIRIQSDNDLPIVGEPVLTIDKQGDIRVQKLTLHGMFGEIKLFNPERLVPEKNITHWAKFNDPVDCQFRR